MRYVPALAIGAIRAVLDFLERVMDQLWGRRGERRLARVIDPRRAWLERVRQQRDKREAASASHTLRFTEGSFE